MTPVFVALISGVFAIVTIIVQAKVHRDNRSDHADTARKVDAVLEAQGTMGADLGEMKADLRDVKADLRDVKADLRDHGARLRAVESPAPAKPARAPRKRTA